MVLVAHRHRVGRAPVARLPGCGSRETRITLNVPTGDRAARFQNVTLRGRTRRGGEQLVTGSSGSASGSGSGTRSSHLAVLRSPGVRLGSGIIKL